MSNATQDTSSMSPTTLRERLVTATDVVIVDVRTSGEFGAGHIPGAVNVPLDQLGGYATRIAATDRELVLVCQSGGRARTAREQLVEAGARTGRVLTGGMSAWTEAGGDTDITESDGAQPRRWTMERQVRLTAGSIVLAGIAASFIWPKARLLSGAIGGGLVFSAVTDTCGMGSLLAKLPYNRAGQADVDGAVARLERAV